MKIEKLLTLSQFVDLIENELDPKSFRGNKHNWPGVYSHIDSIFRYNAFLKQPLKKEMFVNKFINAPDNFSNWRKGMVLTDDFDSTIWYGNCCDWAESEEKVIFENYQIEGMTNYQFCFPKTKKPFRDVSIQDFNTIGDIAEYYEGELKLKNVEL